MFALKTVRTAFTVAASLMLSSQALVAQATPSAAEVIAKYVAAIGGKDAISKMTSYKQIGTMESAASAAAMRDALVCTMPT